MTPDLSPRLRAIVESLPLRPGMRVLEIGCGPGAAARAVARAVAPDGFVLALDRSPRAIAQVEAGCADEIAQGLLRTACASIESFTWGNDDARFDLVFAVRVGALDGRHPTAGDQARERIAQLLAPGGVLSIDGVIHG